MLKLTIYTRIIIFIMPFLVVKGNVTRECDPFDINDLQCSKTELCDKYTKSCRCLPGYENNDDTYCVKVTHSSPSTPNYSSLVDNKGSGSIVAGILIPLFLVIFVICGIYANRKYQLLTWIRNKINRRNENYDEFMIGQDLDDDDDPPLRC